MTLIVGLGNPTSAYKDTRHNIGFEVVDCLANHLKATPIQKSSFKGELFRSNQLFLLKPQTYMNLSGESVLAVKNFYKDTQKMVVIHDDLDLPFGTIRFKRGGSSGGHNGLKSIDHLCGNDYFRVRFGIGRPPKGFETADYVLAKFLANEQEKLIDLITHSAKASLMLVDQPLDLVSSKMSLRGAE